MQSLRALSIGMPQIIDGTAASEVSRQRLLRAIQSTFRYGLFPPLEELDLHVKLAYDIEVLSPSLFQVEPATSPWPLKKVLSQLRQLHVGILDKSGSFGERYYSSEATESQTQFPNAAHARGFFDFVAMATDLESLSISCTHVLDLDLLSIARFKRLRVLILSRIKMSMGHLQRLIFQNTATMHGLDFLEVERKTGTWESLLLSLRSLLSLTNFWVRSCGYIETSRHVRLLLPPIDDPQDLDTLHFNDFDALGQLQCHVTNVRDAAGLAQMSEYDYKWGYITRSSRSEAPVSAD